MTDSRILNVSICVCEKLIVFDSGTCGAVVALAHTISLIALLMFVCICADTNGSVSRGSNM